MAKKRVSGVKKALLSISSGGAKKTDASQQKKATSAPSSGDIKKATASQRKKVSKAPKMIKKEDLVEQMHKHKKGMQEMRFGFSGEQQKSGSRRNLRKQIARATTQLTTLRKNGGVRA